MSVHAVRMHDGRTRWVKSIWFWHTKKYLNDGWMICYSSWLDRLIPTAMRDEPVPSPILMPWGIYVTP